VFLVLLGILVILRFSLGSTNDLWLRSRLKACLKLRHGDLLRNRVRFLRFLVALWLRLRLRLWLIAFIRRLLNLLDHWS